MSRYSDDPPYRRPVVDPYAYQYPAGPSYNAPGPSTRQSKQGYDDYDSGSQYGYGFKTWKELQKKDPASWNELALAWKAWEKLEKKKIIRPFKIAYPTIINSNITKAKTSSGSKSNYPGSAPGYGGGSGSGYGGSSGASQNSYPCNFCDKIYPTKADVEIHEDKRHICQYCRAGFEKEKARNKHEDEHICQYCRKAYEDAKARNSHEKRCSKRR
ncbi:hypothetical protein QBC46DRAFT_427240 [Diplogelasinospora grovesii]|uniref:C2H2-type domain-containing protein n=1 Tax=Diplogelasinospora grovesii TaxID=303347 RepID=A0AAN6RZF0_9PEZI|nr:hypothetical protein QBC46DRAFT_427240 [Diplogelasinospora grovesii]